MCAVVERVWLLLSPLVLYCTATDWCTNLQAYSSLHYNSLKLFTPEGIVESSAITQMLPAVFFYMVKEVQYGNKSEKRLTKRDESIKHKCIKYIKVHKYTENQRIKVKI